MNDSASDPNQASQAPLHKDCLQFSVDLESGRIQCPVLGELTLGDHSYARIILTPQGLALMVPKGCAFVVEFDAEKTGIMMPEVGQ